MSIEYKKITAFTTWYGTYKQFVLPLGLTNASSTFEKLMNSIFSNILDGSLLVYLDNLLVFSPDIDSHNADVQKKLFQLHEHMLKAKVVNVSLQLQKSSI